MTIGPGSRLGPYEVTALLGEGGMGKVWRAHHTGLKRDDALKVLPDAFASDPERLARFQREAQVLASLNHPNIAHVHGLERSDGVQALVMELVEGPTLADRIAQGPIPIDEALPIARQIAEALEAAHERGIVHRDLKPANVKVRPDGTVKVLDFGLAKALEPANAVSPNMSQSPTITSPAMMTGVGVLLGTAAYMSPEQARGKAVDKRSDIWAFGCVLYEMLTGKRAFAGEDISDVLASVLAREPDWALLPGGISPVLGTFLKRCLHKDRKQRVGDAQSLRLAVDGAFETATSRVAQPMVIPQRWWRRPIAVAAGGAIAAILVTSLAAWSFWPTPTSLRVNRFDYALPEGQPFRNPTRLVIAISPDSRHFVYNATGGLYLRAMEALQSRLILGTEGGLTNPVFSPDGESVAYEQANQLKRVSISGGLPIVLCATTTGLFGASWGPDNMILFGQPEGIMRVSANGGMPELYDVGGSRDIFTVKPGESPVRFSETAWEERAPTFSPDGRWLAYSSNETGRAEIYVTPYPGPGNQIAISTGGGRSPRWSFDGRELFYRNGRQMMVVGLEPGPSIRVGTPRVLFEGDFVEELDNFSAHNYDVKRDGQRFLMVAPTPGKVSEEARPKVVVVQNWLEELKRLVPTNN